VLSYEEVRELLSGEFDLLRTFTTRRFDRAQRAVVARYRSLGYIQARVVLDETRELDGGLVDLFVEVREGPRWQIRFEGDRVFSESELLRRLAFYRTGMETGVRLRDPSDSEYLQTLVVRHVNECLDYQASIVQVRNDKAYLFVIPDNEIAAEEDDDEVEAEEAQPAKKPVVKPKPAVVPAKKPAVAARPVPVPVVKPRPSTTTPVKATTTTPEPKPAVDPLKMSNADFEAHMNSLVAKAQAGAATH
jgi:hypothetical protein